MKEREKMKAGARKIILAYIQTEISCFSLPTGNNNFGVKALPNFQAFEEESCGSENNLSLVNEIFFGRKKEVLEKGAGISRDFNCCSRSD